MELTHNAMSELVTVLKWFLVGFFFLIFIAYLIGGSQPQRKSSQAHTGVPFSSHLRDKRKIEPFLFNKA